LHLKLLAVAAKAGRLTVGCAVATRLAMVQRDVGVAMGEHFKELARKETLTPFGRAQVEAWVPIMATAEFTGKTLERPDPHANHLWYNASHCAVMDTKTGRPYVMATGGAFGEDLSPWSL
jgi:hypothetical protein